MNTALTTLPQELHSLCSSYTLAIHNIIPALRQNSALLSDAVEDECAKSIVHLSKDDILVICRALAAKQNSSFSSMVARIKNYFINRDDSLLRSIMTRIEPGLALSADESLAILEVFKKGSPLRQQAAQALCNALPAGTAPLKLRAARDDIAEDMLQTIQQLPNLQILDFHDVS